LSSVEGRFVVRRSVVAFVITFVVALSGVATATVFAGSPSPKPNAATDHDDKAEANEEADADSGVHGGPIERFHQAGGCDLTAVALPGNWTHGDYVSAVAAGGDTTQVQAAAQSDCGKPMVAVGHGGPPAFAMKHAAAGKAHAAAAPGDAGQGPPGN
jgi:hypothetical protein